MPENTDANFTRDLTALRAQYAKNYEDIDKKEAATKAPTVKDTNKSLSRNFEAIVQKNSRDAQAKDFTEYVGEKLIGVVKTDFLDAFKKIDQNNTETVSYELTSVSIPNLLRSLSEGTVYIADGAEWNDRPIVKKFLEIYAKHKAVLDPILSPLIAANRAGQSVESVKKSGTLKTNPNNVDIIAHLTQIDNFNTYGTTGLDRQLAA